MFNYNSLLSKVHILIWLLLLTITGCLPKPKPQTGDFCGKVIDFYTNEPVPGVTLSIGGNQTVTDLKGKFAIAVLPPGDYQLTLERDWYYPITLTEHHIGKQNSLEYSLKPLPLEGKILYSGDGTGDWEIYELNLKDRSEELHSKITFSGINPVKLKNQIIFQSNRGGNNDDLFIGDYSNNIITRMNCYSLLYDDEHPSVDNKGEKMVFKSVQQGTDKRQICCYILASPQFSVGITDGENPVTGYNPVIDPNGEKIAFVSGDYTRLLIYSISGASITKIKEFDLSVLYNLKLNNPCWNPSGTSIAFDAWLADGLKYIYTIDFNSGSLSRITNSYSANDCHEHPCWSRDGTLIFFTGKIIYSSREDIYCVRVNDGSSWVMVAGGKGNKKYPCWSDLP